MNKRQAKKCTKKQIKALEEAVKTINSVDWKRVGEIIVEGTKEVLKEFELYMKELAEGDIKNKNAAFSQQKGNKNAAFSQQKGNCKGEGYEIKKRA